MKSIVFGFHSNVYDNTWIYCKYDLFTVRIITKFIKRNFQTTKKSTKPKMEASEYFFINVTGQIDCAYYPIGFDGQKLFSRYDIVAGHDWELVSGFSSGVTQSASVGETNEKVVFNMPIEMMFKSTNPFGCRFI